MMRSLFSGVSGLKNHQTRMDVIGNNISNVNTVGFKSSRVTFVDMLSQTQTVATAPKANVGGTNPKQIGVGSAVGSIDLMFQDGSVQSTGKNTDLCLAGNGLFVVNRGNERFYTRDGAFEFDSDGNYVLPGSGLYVQGWSAKDGVVDTTDIPTNINVQVGKSMAAKASTVVKYANNLNADIPMVVGIDGGVNAVKNLTANDVTSAASSMSPGLSIKLGNVPCTLTNISGPIDLSKKWTVASDVAAGATQITIQDSNDSTNQVNLTVLPTTSEIPKNVSISLLSNIIPVASVGDGTAGNPDPVEFTVDGKTYKVKALDNTMDLSKTWKVANDVIGTPAAPATTIAITDGSNTITLTLDDSTQVTETIEQGKKVREKLNTSVASTEKPVTVSLSDGTSIIQTNGTYQVGQSQPLTTTITVYDTLGATHEIPVYFIRQGEATSEPQSDGTTKNVVTSIDKWVVSLEPDASVKPDQDTEFEIIEDNGTKTTVTLKASEIQFTTSGKLVTDGETDKTKDTILTFTSGAVGETDGLLPKDPTYQPVSIDFSAITQFSGNNTINGTPNGNAAGTLKEIQIDTSGVILGIYSNGIRQPEAQVAIAQFTNATGLTKTGNSLYQESNNSGVPNIKTADDLGVSITPSALEMSNVDVANEFADMIVTQRGFQSNSKIVTVGDEMLETLINMKR